MSLARPRELAYPVSVVVPNPYLKSAGSPIFSPNVSSYTEHLFHARRPSKTTMPRPNPPPTPGSSSDLRGKEGHHGAPTFNLPPNAFAEVDKASIGSATSSANGSDSSYRPISPPSPAEASRKRPAPQSSQIVTKDDFELPPPPTRSRKIIQMKPKRNEEQDRCARPVANDGLVDGRAQATQTSVKRKQNNANSTAAGRKIARKTAHSLIERRRRSKMNEEFGVLKDMIPACKGQEMHKLAILQASIDYLRYLEQCVTDLQAQNTSPRLSRALASARRTGQDLGDNDNDDEDDEDQEMEDETEGETDISTPAAASQTQSATAVSLPPLSHITASTTMSPSMLPSGTDRHYSISSASQASYSPYFHSNQTSPAFGPQLSHTSTAPNLPTPYSATKEIFGLGSPALNPINSSQQARRGADGDSKISSQRRQTTKNRRSEQELDQEATAALLMLNNDRRSWRTSPEGGHGRSSTGMSVKDLLSG